MARPSRALLVGLVLCAALLALAAQPAAAKRRHPRGDAGGAAKQPPKQPKAPGGLLWHAPKPKLHDEAHASHKYAAYRAAKSGRTGQVRVRTPGVRKHGRRLQQATGDQTIVQGMSLCPSAADAANFIVGQHASQLSVSNAQFTAGLCSISNYTAGGGYSTNGLQWGIVQSWPADHALAGVFGGSGALVLGSGDTVEAQRVVNDLDGFTADNQQPGDADLDALIPGYSTFDAASLQFDVVPAKDGALVFQYVFASEEYNEWVGSPYNDVFGFWISGPGIVGPGGDGTPLNIAFLPDQVTPTSINNVNNGAHSQYYNDNDLDPRPTVFPPPSPFNTSYDGFTTLLNTRSVSVLAGQKYHFKLAIADAGDHILDSVVWIAGGSLLVNKPPTVTTDGPFTLACPGSVAMHATGADEDGDAIQYAWNLTSTDGAVHIAKYTASATLTSPDDAIPAGTYSAAVTAIDVHGARTTSAPSTLTVLPCPAPAGNQPPLPTFSGAPFTLEACNGVGSATLSAAATDPDGDAVQRFVWEISSGDFEVKLSGQTVTVTAAMGFFAGNTYEVEVFASDAYGAVSMAETTLTVVPTAGCQPGGGSGGGGSGGGGSGGGGGGGSGGGGSGTFTEAIITGGPYALACDGSLTLDGSASTSFDGAPLSFQWDFYDAASGAVYTIPESAMAGGTNTIADPTAAVSLASQPWLSLGVTYSLSLNVWDSTGSVASDGTTFTTPAACNHPPTAAATASSYTLPCNGQATLDGSPSSDPDAGDALTYSWEVYAKGSSAAAGDTALTTGAAATLTLAFGAPLAPGATYDAYLTVTDQAGATSAPAKVSVVAQSCNRPPVAKLSGAPYSLSCGGTTQLDGTASSDPDGNDSIKGYTFTVYNAANKLVATKTSTNGKATLSQAADSLPTNAAYTLVLTVADAEGATGTANTTLTTGNCAPKAAITTPTLTIACGGSVVLDGTGSTDADGTVASWSWKLVYGATSISKSGSKATVSQTTDKLVSGATYAVQLTVTDNKGTKSALANGTLAVASGCVTNSPPVCTSAKANVSRISVLNHTYVPISIIGVTDSDAGDVITLSVTGVTQDESVTASDTTVPGAWACPDAKFSGATAQVAAEALAATTTGNGRVYKVSFKATDKAGASCTGTVTVCARPGTTGCVTDAASFTSTTCA